MRVLLGVPVVALLVVGSVLLGSGRTQPLSAQEQVATPAKTFMVTYTYVPGMEERRQPYRADHLQRLGQARDQGMLVLAGGFADPVDGALLLFEANDQGEVLSWVGGDPYAQAGLIRAVVVREIGVAVRR